MRPITERNYKQVMQETISILNAASRHLDSINSTKSEIEAINSAIKHINQALRMHKTSIIREKQHNYYEQQIDKAKKAKDRVSKIRQASVLRNTEELIEKHNIQQYLSTDPRDINNEKNGS